MADKNPFASVGLGMFGSEGQQSGLGQDVLAGLTAYGIDKSGLKDFLNSKGISKNNQGQWGYAAPAVPPAAVSTAPVAPVAPTIQEAVAPAASPAPVNTAPTPTKPSGLGDKILDNDWHGADDHSQEEQNKFASQSASEFVPTMGYKPDYASDQLKKFAASFMMG